MDLKVQLIYIIVPYIKVMIHLIQRRLSRSRTVFNVIMEMDNQTNRLRFYPQSNIMIMYGKIKRRTGGDHRYIEEVIEIVQDSGTYPDFLYLSPNIEKIKMMQ